MGMVKSGLMLSNLQVSARIGNVAENTRPAQKSTATRFAQVFGDVSQGRRWGSDGASLESVLGFSHDPIGYRGKDFNLYRYCVNNPLIWTDARGLCYVGGARVANCQSESEPAPPACRVCTHGPNLFEWWNGGGYAPEPEPSPAPVPASPRSPISPGIPSPPNPNCCIGATETDSERATRESRARDEYQQCLKGVQEWEDGALWRAKWVGSPGVAAVLGWCGGEVLGFWGAMGGGMGGDIGSMISFEAAIEKLAAWGRENCKRQYDENMKPPSGNCGDKPPQGPPQMDPCTQWLIDPFGLDPNNPNHP